MKELNSCPSKNGEIFMKIEKIHFNCISAIILECVSRMKNEMKLMVAILVIYAN